MTDRHAQLIATAILMLGCTTLSVPLYFYAGGSGIAVATFVTAIASALLLVEYVASWLPPLLRRSKSPKLQCGCGYDLRGTIRAGKTECPECGRRFLDDAA